MNKKFSNLIAWVVIFFCVALFTLVLNWYWVKNDSAIQGLIFGLLFSFIGAIVGGLTSGYGSYLGGVQGAKENYELKKKQDEYLATTTLLRLIDFTYEAVKSKKEFLDTGSIEFNVIYDNEWPKYLSSSGSFDTREIANIILWFKTLKSLEKTIEENKGKINKFSFLIMVEHHLLGIEKILEDKSNIYTRLNF